MAAQCRVPYWGPLKYLVEGWLDGDLRRFGLASLVDEVLYISDLGHAKPHPAVFLGAARRPGVAPDACVMVGDDPLCDVSDALGMGMMAIWKRNASLVADPDYTGPLNTSPLATIDDLADLPALLSRLPD